MSAREPAAVLVPVYRDGHGHLRIVLIRRVAGGIHGGQIAFPGGRVEPSDRSHEAAAVREAQEEIGLTPAAILLLGALPSVRTRSSGFEIRPFLAHIRPPATWDLQANEVVGVLTPSVDRLRSPERLGTTEVRPLSWLTPRRVPCIWLDPETFVWGATYRILRPLLRRLAAGDWPV